MLCNECDKVFTHPEGLEGLADSSNMAGRHHDSLVAFRSAAQEGCHVCAIAAAHLSEHPSAGGFRFTLGRSDGGVFVFRLFRHVEGDDGESDNGPERSSLTLRLYPFNEGETISPASGAA